jgi:hypothetical protein
MAVKQYIPAIKYGNLVAGDEIEAGAVLTTPNIGAATGTSVAVTGGVVVESATAVPATAGAIAAGAPITLFSAGPSIYVTSDAPTFTAIKGSLCINTGGSSSSTRLYVNNGTTNWVAVTTAS